MVSFLRSVCKKSFFEQSSTLDDGGASITKRILLTRPTNLFYERYVFSFYLQVLRYIADKLEQKATLEEDLELLSRGEPGNPLPAISFELRMAVVYRSEKKKIIRSQINLIQKVSTVLKSIEEVLLNVPSGADGSRAFQELLLAETP